MPKLEGESKEFGFRGSAYKRKYFTVLNVGEVQRKDKRKLEKLFRYILRLLGLGSRFMGICNLDIQVHPGEEEDNSTEIIIRLPIEGVNHLKSQRESTQDDSFRYKPGLFLEATENVLSGSDSRFIKELNRVVESHYQDQDFNVEQLAKILQLSQPTLYRKIRELTGTNPCDFIRSFRLDKGAQLLKNNFGQVIDVALEVGFNSRIYFTKCFKEKFNLTPSQFLEQESPGAEEQQMEFQTGGRKTEYLSSF